MLLLLALIVPLGVVGIDILPDLQIRTVQSTAVQGKLLCNGKPYEKARLKLYEVDPLKDTLMDEAFSDKDGHFKLKGNDTEWSKIDPKLNIYHNCEDEKVVRVRVSSNLPTVSHPSRRLKTYGSYFVVQGRDGS
ncbi:Transthyretin-like family protein [Ostertagia ostertagi]